MGREPYLKKGDLLIDRAGFRVSAIKIKDGKCQECREGVQIVE